MIQPNSDSLLEDVAPFDELEVIETCVKALLYMTIEEQERIIRYLQARFILPPTPVRVYQP